MEAGTHSNKPAPAGHTTTRALLPWLPLDTPLQRAAAELFAMGFSVGPTKPASKEPYLWRKLAVARIVPAFIPELFDNDAGLFVMVGGISRNLTILDCESDAEAQIQVAEFTRRDLWPWVFRTGRGKGLCWLSAEGELANVRIEKTDGDYEIRGHNCYCLFPPSVHPNWKQNPGRKYYTWEYRAGVEPPTLSMTVLDWLPVKLAVKSRRKYEPHEAGPLDCLSRPNQEYIAHGASIGTRANRLFAAACDMQGNEFDYYKAREILTPRAENDGLTRREITGIINNAYSQPRTRAKESHFQPTPAWALAQAWGEDHKWERMETLRPTRGRKAQTTTKRYAVSAHTARRVWMAVCERARRDNASVFRASCREVAELARMKSDTAHAGLVCLVAAGWLKRCGATSVQAALFAFDRSVLQKRDSNPHLSLSTVPFTQHTHDAFERGGLGATAERVWRLILNERRRAVEIARRLQAHRSTVGRALQRLATWGLVTESADGVWKGNPADETYLTEVAAKLGTLGKAQKRKAEHVQERCNDVSISILKSKRRRELRQQRLPALPSLPVNMSVTNAISEQVSKSGSEQPALMATNDEQVSKVGN